MTTTVRLPFTLFPAEGEDLHTWLATYAFLLDTTVEALAEVLGITPVNGTRLAGRRATGAPDRLAAAIAVATGLEHSVVHTLLSAPRPARPLGATPVAIALRTRPMLLHRTGHSAVDHYITAATARLDTPDRLTAYDDLNDLILIAAHLGTGTARPSFAAATLGKHCDRDRLTAAMRILTFHSDADGDPLAGLVGFRPSPDHARTPLPASWAAASPALARRIARLPAARPSPVGRIRFATTTPAAGAMPRRAGDPAILAAALPDQFWPDWAIRLANDDVNNIWFRSHMAAALLLPGARADLTEITQVFGTGITADGLSHQLRRLAATEHGEHALRILTELAVRLRAEGTAIDYARRRALAAAAPLIDPDTCQTLMNRGGINRGGERRLRHVRAWLYELVTGGNAGTAPEHLRITEGEDRAIYHEFCAAMPAALATDFTDHARTMLTDNGIHEPLTWRPPPDWIDTHHWPGADPDHTDPAAVHTVILRRWSTTPPHWAPTAAAAAELGISVEHLRHVLREHPMPHPPYQQTGPSIIITHATGPRPWNHDQHPRSASRSGTLTIDRGWLEDQYVTTRRTINAIAAQIGCTKATLRNAMHAAGIPIRRQGGSDYITDSTLAALPDDGPPLLRRALADPRGPHQLQRFLDIIEHGSLNRAARAAGISQSGLTHQLKTLERRCGGPLFHHRPQPAPLRHLTDLGQQLCEQARSRRHLAG